MGTWILLGVKTPVRKGDDLTTFTVPKVEKIRYLNLPNPQGPAQACSGKTLPTYWTLNAVMPGHITEERIPQNLTELNAYVIRCETFPMSRDSTPRVRLPAEALACGTAVVPGDPQWATGETDCLLSLGVRSGIMPSFVCVSSNTISRWLSQGLHWALFFILLRNIVLWYSFIAWLSELSLKAQREGGTVAVPIQNLDARRWGGGSAPRPGRFTPGKETRYPLYGRLVGLGTVLAGYRKSRSHRGSNPGSSNP
jgi:hypothetical protein